MRDAVYFAGILLVLLFGLPLWRIDVLRRLDLPGRLAVALAGGMVILSALMFMETLLHVPWSRMTLVPPLLAIIAAGLIPWPGRRPLAAGTTIQTTRRLNPSLIGIAVIIGLTVYAVLTARETCADLMYFWGPKAIRFNLVGGIDAKFLAFPHYYLMHPDYPPLLPLLYDWGALVAHRFSWWGSLLLTPLCLGASVFAFRSFARQVIGEASASRFALLLGAMLGCGFATGMVAGGADPVLILFETIVVSILTFLPNERGSLLLASIALAGIAITKLEGGLFVAVTLIAFLLVQRRIVAAIRLVAPAILLLGGWIAWVIHYGLLDLYKLGGAAAHIRLLPTVLRVTLREASYEAMYIPWIGSIATLALGRNIRRGLFPLLIAGGSIAAILFSYLHMDNPAWWVQSSAKRVLLTPLMCLVVAAAAASEG
jgi:hypothetical protein